METACAPCVTVFAVSMQIGQQRRARYERSYRNPELHVGQNCFQHLDEPKRVVRWQSKKMGCSRNWWASRWAAAADDFWHGIFRSTAAVPSRTRTSPTSASRISTTAPR